MFCVIINQYTNNDDELQLSYFDTEELAKQFVSRYNEAAQGSCSYAVYMGCSENYYA